MNEQVHAILLPVPVDVGLERIEGPSPLRLS